MIGQQVHDQIADINSIFDEESITIAIPGRPVPKARPRFIPRCGKCIPYDPQYQDKRTCTEQVRVRCKDHEPLDGPIAVSVVFIYQKPKSRQTSETVHSIKPDLDNLLKWILDIGNTILWNDDKQIASLQGIKIYGENERTVITVSKLREG